MHLGCGIRKKKLSSLVGREDSAFILSDNLYLLLKKDKVARFLRASTVATFPDVKPHAEANLHPGSLEWEEG